MNKISIVTNKSNLRKVDLVIVILILIASLKLTFGLENIFDIELWDESNYLYRGVKLVIEGGTTAWSPLYSLWYYLISLFQPDRVNLFYLNYKLMIILPPILTYILLRKNKAPIYLSLIVSFFLLASYALIFISVRVSHLALILILVTLILISFTNSFFRASLLASFGALGVSYIRPEYFLTYVLLLLILTITIAFAYKKLSRDQLTSLIVFVSSSILLLFILGIPTSGDRSMIAFGQHFSLNWTQWTDSKLNPFSDWQIIISENFGAAQNIFEAFRNNPSMFLRHIIYNLRETMPHHFFPLLVPIFPLGNFFKTVGILLIFGFLIRNISHIHKNLIEYRKFLFFAGLFLLPELISVALIYPRDHYLLLPFVLIIIVVATLVGSHPLEEESIIYIFITILLGLLLIVITPTFSAQTTTFKPNLTTIRTIQSLNIKKPVNLLENGGGYYIYLSDNFRWVTSFDKSESFNIFLLDKKINMIVVNKPLSIDTHFRYDREWKQFLKNYAEFDFTQIDIPNSENVILVKDDLLNK